MAESHRTVLKLDVSWFQRYPRWEAHNRYALSCFHITEQFATQDEVDHLRDAHLGRLIRWRINAARRLNFNGYAHRHSNQADWGKRQRHKFDPQVLAQPNGTYLQGMFQSEKYFLRVSQLLRLHFSFRYPAHPEVLALAERLRSGLSIAVHFRRGDLVTNPRFRAKMGVIGLDYYRRAFSMIHAQFPKATFYVFSNDIEAVAQEFIPPERTVWVRENPDWDASDLMRLMSLCHHAMTSNSIFAWWGAWLNPSPQKQVVTPTPWFADPAVDNTHIVPAAWIQLPR